VHFPLHHEVLLVDGDWLGHYLFTRLQVQSLLQVGLLLKLQQKRDELQGW
jgi:hypothetical protein